jgi:hypothetical protein
MYKSFTSTYDFTDEVLRTDIPPYLKDPFANWIKNVLEKKEKLYGQYNNSIIETYADDIQINFHREISRYLPNFIQSLFDDIDFLTNYLTFILQKDCNKIDAQKLENILAIGGSAYAVEITESSLPGSNYKFTKCYLVERVPQLVRKIQRRHFRKINYCRKLGLNTINIILIMRKV